MRIEEGLDAYALQLEADGRSQHTVAQVRRHVLLLALWARRVGACREVEALEHGDVARFLASADARTRPDGKAKKATSVNALRSSIKTFLGYLHAAGLIRTNPGRLIRRAITGDPPPKAMSEKEQRRFMDALEKAQTPVELRDRMLFRLMLGTGIRLGSALGIRWEDVDLEALELRLRCTKGDREQVVYLPQNVLVWAPGAVYEDHEYVFPGSKGAKLCARHVQRRLAIWLERAGIAKRFSPHSLRHTFATNLYRQTEDVVLVQRALGHRSIASTVAYARPSEKRVRAALAVTCPPSAM